MFLAFALSSFSIHKFYVSIYKVEFVPEKKRIEITARIFLDDITVALEKEYKTKILETWEELPDIYITSAEKKIGGEEILKFVEKTNNYLVKNKIKFQ